jgi:hypothetical protein
MEEGPERNVTCFGTQKARLRKIHPKLGAHVLHASALFATSQHPVN